MEIGFKVKKIRELRNYTQEHMAEKLGISQVSYSRIENGKTKLSIQRLEEIALLFDVSIIIIISFDENKLLRSVNKLEQ